MSRILGTITILTEDRHKNSKIINEILYDCSSLLIARMGINLERKCIAGCMALIMGAVDGEAREIKKILKKLNSVKNVNAKFTEMTRP